jgi:hypothetical protein
MQHRVIPPVASCVEPFHACFPSRCLALLLHALVACLAYTFKRPGHLSLPAPRLATSSSIPPWLDSCAVCPYLHRINLDFLPIYQALRRVRTCAVSSLFSSLLSGQPTEAVFAAHLHRFLLLPAINSLVIFPASSSWTALGFQLPCHYLQRECIHFFYSNTVFVGL